MAHTQVGGFTVSGPGLDTAYPEMGAALSRAITAAEHGGRDGSVYYVRDLLGRVVAQVARDGKTTTVRVVPDRERRAA